MVKYHIDKGNKRNELILKVLYNTGIRVSELISLNKEDITNWKDGELIIMGKGAKKRKIKLGQKLWKEIKKYLQER